MSLIEKALSKMRTDGGARVPQPANLLSVQTAEAPRGAANAPSATVPRKFDPNALAGLAGRIVQLDENALRQAHVLPPKDEARRVAGEYRAIKRTLIRAAFDEGEDSTPSRQIVALSSALPGDGKTYTSINLALSLARERDYQVVLVDADVAKPHVSALLGIEQDRGLLDFLESPEVALRDVLMATSVPKLWLVSAGRQSEHSTELLASDRMRVFAEELVGLFPNALIVLDAPPLLLTSEARALVAVAGQVVLVVKCAETPRQAVMDAIEATQAPERIKLLFNQANTSGFSNYYYGSWQGYGRPHGGGDKSSTHAGGGGD
jgi:protein-tyrosine kinase